MTYEKLLFTTADGVATLTLNRPDKLNSFDRQMSMEVIHALDTCAADATVRAMLITGAGRAFSAGQDLAEAIAPGTKIEDILTTQYNPIVRRIRDLKKPVIAAVNGVAAGAGANIAFACDLAIAAESASFIQSFINIGLIPDSGGTFTLPRLVGMQRAFGQMILAPKVTAKEAEAQGMIWKCAGDTELMNEAAALAQKLAVMPTKAIALTKEALNRSMTNSLTQQLDVENELQTIAGRSHDYSEGVKAFLEKRKPVYRETDRSNDPLPHLRCMDKSMKVAVIGAGTMGSGIAQVAAQAGHSVQLFDTRADAVTKAVDALNKTFSKLVEKGKLSADEAKTTLGRISPCIDLKELARCGLVIEAIVEDLPIKKKLFTDLEAILAKDALLATNTSSLSVTAIAGACAIPERVIGLHFFNPAPLLPLVEVVPGIATGEGLPAHCMELMKAWGKTPVLCKDTPGFIVNRVARPFYGEALRIYEEGLADMATIDHAMKSVGGFKMGPFELMDLIGNDINFAVTKSVFEAFFFDPRYRPSITQQRQVESGRLGRKSGRGYYVHTDGAVQPAPKNDLQLLEDICWRILVMLINEAVDALNLGIASRDDLDLAMTKGVNYPKGLLRWADEKGLAHCLSTLERLQAEYGEDRYRPSPLLRRMVRESRTFH